MSFKCQLCHRSLQNKKTFQAHIDKLHNTRFDCYLCKQTYKSYTTLHAHLRAFHGQFVKVRSDKVFFDAKEFSKAQTHVLKFALRGTTKNSKSSFKFPAKKRKKPTARVCEPTTSEISYQEAPIQIPEYNSLIRPSSPLIECQGDPLDLRTRKESIDLEIAPSSDEDTISFDQHEIKSEPTTP